MRQAIEQWLLATLLARYPFQVPALPAALRDRVSGHAVIDLRLSWKISSSGTPVSLDIGVRNAADHR